MTGEIKCCPFCGAESAMLSQTMLPPGQWWHHIDCDPTNGGCGAQSGYATSEAEAIAAWNTRAIEATRPTDMEIRDAE